MHKLHVIFFLFITFCISPASIRAELRQGRISPQKKQRCFRQFRRIQAKFSRFQPGPSIYAVQRLLKRCPIASIAATGGEWSYKHAKKFDQSINFYALATQLEPSNPMYKINLERATQAFSNLAKARLMGPVSVGNQTTGEKRFRVRFNRYSNNQNKKTNLNKNVKKNPIKKRLKRSPRTTARKKKSTHVQQNKNLQVKRQIDVEILFAYNSSRVSKVGKVLLKVVARNLQIYARQGARFKLVGHTDSTGSIRYNKRLSLKRAKAVWKFLRKHGVTMGVLRAQGLGPHQPVATNKTPEGRHQNRRVEIVRLR